MSNNTHPHGMQPILAAGTTPEDAAGAIIMVHGRGASAQSILPLGVELAGGASNIAFVAPQAAGATWYPQSFMAPMPANEPKLSSALQRVEETVQSMLDSGIPAEKIIIGGFSQGACLASEYVARHAKRFGGLVIFSGGLIGPEGTPRDYDGSLDGTPVFIGCSDVDFHIPVERVHETAEVLEKLGGKVTKKIYPGMAHTINDDELSHGRELVAQAFAAQ